MKQRSRLVIALYSWSDVLWALLIFFFALVSTTQDDKSAADTKAGALSVYVEWTDGLDLDVDTWIEYPMNPLPLYYNRLQGLNGWIGRDDKGISDSKANSENAALYDMEPGNYTINIHAFRQGNGASFPASVKVIVTYVAKEGGRKAVFDGYVELKDVKQEVTVVRFTLDDQKKIVDVNRLYKNLINKETVGGGGEPDAHQ